MTVVTGTRSNLVELAIINLSSDIMTYTDEAYIIAVKRHTRWKRDTEFKQLYPRQGAVKIYLSLKGSNYDDTFL